MKITEALLGEHGVFYALMEHLEQVVKTSNSLDLIQQLASMLTAALATHADIENALLFSTLESHIGPMGPLAVMRQEHDEIERTLDRVQKASDLAEAQQGVLHALQVARDHFAKEEQVLFPMAHQMLDEETLTRLGTQWAELRKLTTI